jgi:anaerobic dimethyl sulfoxide reductase subunit B (iron-sulfur subunit)
MATYGLLIDYEYCTNCGSCIVSCKEEHAYPVGKWGIQVHSDGPWAIDEETWNWNFYPMPTDLCDLCANRTAAGREPICVHHCLSNIISYGPVEELAKKLEDKPKQFLIVPAFKPMTNKEPFVHKHNKTDDHKLEQLEAYSDGVSRTSTHRNFEYEDEWEGHLDENKYAGE